MIFSGEESKKLWDSINKLQDINWNSWDGGKDVFFAIWEAIYLLASKCQELEGELKKEREGK